MLRFQDLTSSDIINQLWKLRVSSVYSIFIVAHSQHSFQQKQKIALRKPAELQGQQTARKDCITMLFPRCGVKNFGVALGVFR